MSKIIHVYFGDHKKHPIINNYLRGCNYSFQVIDVPKLKLGRFNRMILLVKLLIKIKKNRNFSFHVHDLISFYLVKLIFPFRKVLFDSHEVYRSYFRGGLYLVVYFLEEISTLLATYKFLPSKERSKLYYFKKCTFIVENLYLPKKKVKLECSCQQKKSFVYAGLLGDKRCIKELVSLFKEIPSYNLTIYGQNTAYFTKILEKGLPKNVIYGGELTQEELFKVLPKFIASFALYKPSDLNNTYPAPTKVFENEFYGLPTILFKSSYVDRLIESEVLKNTYTIESLDKENFEKYLKNIQLKLSAPNLSKKILWSSQNGLIIKVYESMLLNNE